MVFNSLRGQSRLAGALVREAESAGVTLDNLPMKTFQEASAAFEEDIRAVLAAAWTIPAEGVMGGSNRASIKRQLKALRGWLER